MGGLPGRVVGMASGSKMGVPMLTRTWAAWPSGPVCEVEGEDAPAGLDGDLGAAGDAVVVDVLGDAADAVAAHLAFGAVGVEHAHAGVGPFGGGDQDQAVGADAEVAVADGAGEGGQVAGGGLVEEVDVDVVVAEAVHLGESHGAGLRVVAR